MSQINGPLHSLLLIPLFALTFISCTFDYGDLEGSESTLPDMVMEDLEYVRVRDGKPIVRFQAEVAEQYESDRSMHIKQMRFEQYTPKDGEADAVGQAGFAYINLSTGDTHLIEGVRITVPSEDISIETSELIWEDSTRILRGTEDGAALIKRGDGSLVSGIGLYADVRNQTWEFLSTVSGIYVDEDEEEDKEEIQKSDEPETMDETTQETPAEGVVP